MKKKLLLTILFICFYAYLQAQDFINYHGDAEKNLVNSVQTPDELVKLAFASELNGDEYQVLYDKFMQDVKQLNLESIPNDKSEKHLKKVYQLVHDRFLKVYDPQAHFGDFEMNGQYQCLSASILYAYILERLNVPYQITQLPAHTYVIANAGAGNIKFETIDPARGFYMFDDQAKQKNVTNLIKDGYLDQSYVIRVGVERAFDDFFYNKVNISLKEAVGLLYFNKALFEMEANVNEAYSDLCKSDILFPDKKNEYLENELLGDMVNTFKYDDLKDWKALTHFANRKSESDQAKKFLEFKFDDFLNTKLLNAGQKDKVNEVFNYLRANVTDTAVKKHIMENYFFESAHYAYITNDYALSLSCLETAYGINPNNPLIISDFANMILHKFSGKAPSATNLILLNNYMDKYPLLKNNSIIASIYEYYNAFLSINGFVTGDGAAGEKYMQALMHELDVNPDNDNKYHQIIANVFARGSVYYWQKQQKQKAIATIKLGLKYEPADDELLRKLKADTGN